MAKRKRQTTQWPKEKDRQHNDQKKKDKKTNNNDLENITQKSKHRATQTPTKLGVNSGALEG
jgi:hypothetical protein